MQGAGGDTHGGGPPHGTGAGAGRGGVGEPGDMAAGLQARGAGRPGQEQSAPLPRKHTSARPPARRARSNTTLLLTRTPPCPFPAPRPASLDLPSALREKTLARAAEGGASDGMYRGMAGYTDYRASFKREKTVGRPPFGGGRRGGLIACVCLQSQAGDAPPPRGGCGRERKKMVARPLAACRARARRARLYPPGTPPPRAPPGSTPSLPTPLPPSWQVGSEKGAGAHGPLRASAFVRVSARFDYQVRARVQTGGGQGPL